MTVDAIPTALPAARRRQIASQARMELRLMLRNGESLLVTMGIPLGILVFFSAVDILPTGSGDPVEFLVPGVLAISVMSTGLVAVAIQTGFERKYAVLKRLGATPLRRSSYIAAKGLAVAAITMVQVVLVVLIATLGLDWTPTGAFGFASLGVAAGVFAFTSMGLLMAGTLRAEATLAGANALYLLLLMVSGLAFEAGSLPGPLEALTRATPSGALGHVLRDAVAADGGSLDVTGLLVVLAWGALAGAAAARWFRWEP